MSNNSENPIEKKLKFSFLFGENVRFKLPNKLFKTSSFSDEYKKFFGKYSRDISENNVVLEMELLSYSNGGLHVSPAIPPYCPINEVGVLVKYGRDAVIGMGAMTLASRYLNQKLVNDYLEANLDPLYKKLTRVDGLIDRGEDRNLESFIYLNVAKYIYGERTDVSETIYSYFLEAEKIYKGGN